MNNKLELIRITFASKMEDICSQQTSQSSKYMSSEKYYEIIEKLEKIRNFPEKPKSQETYRLMKRYEIDSIIIDDIPTISLKKKGTDLRFLTIHQVYDAIYERYSSLGQPGRDRLWKDLKLK